MGKQKSSYKSALDGLHHYLSRHLPFSRAEFQQLLQNVGVAGSVRLDFSQVTRINSMGIALLLKALKELRHSGKRIRLTGANRMTATLFKMMGLGHWAELS